MRDDIALIKTETSIEFTPTVQPIYLGSYYITNGTSATVSGWGYTTHPGYVASKLQFISVKVVENNECRSRMSASNAAKVFDSSLCAQSEQTGGAWYEQTKFFNYLNFIKKPLVILAWETLGDL